MSIIENSYTISAGDWCAVACPRLGANIISLTYRGRDVLVPLRDEAALATNPYLQGAPLLLPANRTYLGKFTFEGKEYTLPITEPRTNSNLHGVLHRQAFTLISHSEREIVMSYSAGGEVYPFSFDITVTYKVDEGGLSQKFEITNTGKGRMPYTFSLHTTFTEPERFSLPVALRQENDKTDIPTGRYLPLSEQEENYFFGSPSRGLNVTGYFTSAGNFATVDEISYTVSDNFDYWIMYNGAGRGGFLCIEPQAGAVNGLNIEDGHKVLYPEERVTYTTRFSHIEK